LPADGYLVVSVPHSYPFHADPIDTLFRPAPDEVVTMFLPRQIELGRTAPPPVSLALEPDEGGRWVLTGDDPAPAATVTGPAEAVLLLLWHRVGLDDPRLAVAGSRAAADAVLAVALTP